MPVNFLFSSLSIYLQASKAPAKLLQHPVSFYLYAVPVAAPDTFCEGLAPSFHGSEL